MRASGIAAACLFTGCAIASCADFGADAATSPDESLDGSAGVDGAASAETGSDDATVETCTGKDLASDPRHCGACLHDCSLGACTGGKCEPWLVSTATSVVTGLDVDGPGERIYFGVGSEVWRAYTDGRSLERMTTLPDGAVVSAITRSDLGMLACSAAGIHQIPPVAGAPTAVYTAVTSCTGIVADGATIWAAGPLQIAEIRTGNSQVLLHPAPTFPNAPNGEVDVDNLYLYFTTDYEGVRRISKTALDGGSSRVGPDIFSSPQGLAVTGGHAYVTAFGPRALTRIAINDGGVETLASLDGGFTYSQRAARSPSASSIFYAVGSRVFGIVAPR